MEWIDVFYEQWHWQLTIVTLVTSHLEKLVIIKHDYGIEVFLMLKVA